MAESTGAEHRRRPVVTLLDDMHAASRAVLTTRFEPDFELRFAAEGGEAGARAIREADALLTMWGAVDADTLDLAGRCVVIQKLGVGVEKIDVDAARRNGIIVLRAAGVNAEAVSELAVLLTLGLSRRLQSAIDQLRSGVFAKEALRAQSFQLVGKTVGLLGFGHIGQRVAALFTAFGCQVLFHDPHRTELSTDTAREVPFDELLRESDILSLHAPSTPETMRIIGAEALSKMKRTAILINTARGSLVDEAALIDALRRGTIAGAGLDVTETEPLPTDSPLFQFDNVLVTPHIGGAVADNFPNVAERAFHNLSSVFAGREVAQPDVAVWPEPRRQVTADAPDPAASPDHRRRPADRECVRTE